MDWDKEAEKDKEKGTYIALLNTVLTTRKHTLGTLNSLTDPRLSALFNTINSTRHDTTSVYVCKEGCSHGKIRDGWTCTKCGTKVELRFSSDTDLHAWIPLPKSKTGQQYKILTPIAVNLLKSFLGTDYFKKIVNIDYSIDLNGKMIINKYSSKNTKVQDSLIQFKNYGILGLYNHFEKIINIGSKKFKGNTLMKDIPEYRESVVTKFSEYLLENKEALFASHIRVVPPSLRPIVSVSGNTHRYDDINKLYMSIISDVTTLDKLIKNSHAPKQIMDIKINEKLCSIMLDIMTGSGVKHDNIAAMITKTCSGKKGFPRQKILGSRFDFSCRMVVVSHVPKNNYHMNGVGIGIRPFMELYKFHLINLLGKTRQFLTSTTFERLTYIRDQIIASNIDPWFEDLIREWHANHKYGFPAIINRNPSIEVGSLQYHKIRYLHSNNDYFTMSIPLTTPKSMTGDFDGDVLDMWLLLEECVSEAFKTLDPGTLLTGVTGDTGNDSRFIPYNSQLLGINSFLNKSKKRLPDDWYIDTLAAPPEELTIRYAMTTEQNAPEKVSRCYRQGQYSERELGTFTVVEPHN